jgi:3',5'-cyclic AMP phosphodiesterase CpdA
MHRIAHISDLHVSNLSPPDLTGLQWLGKILLRDKFKVDVVAEKHNDAKLEALKNAFRSLRPDTIVITGDITNYGDSASYQVAAKIIENLKQVAEAKEVICIPGNHDCLAERIAVLRNRGWKTRAAIWVASLWAQEAALAREKSFDSKLTARIENGEDVGLFNNFAEAITKRAWGEPNPSVPIFVDGRWGQIAFFLFNSTNDPGYMANEGSIGQIQYNLLNQFLDDPANQEKLNCVRIALLHHHPINNPDIDADAAERGYNSMRDGTLFMKYMGQRRFHFILHGHQHVPYCWKSHPDLGAHVLAAGSATAGDNPSHGSFGVIDLMTPFEALYRRFDYKPTGYAENKSEEKPLAVRALDQLRITPMEQPETSQDVALQTLFGLRKQGWDEIHEYELLDYDVRVSDTELYQAAYRRKGKVVAGEGSDTGLTFVITGSPPMKYGDMKVTATDGQGRKLDLKAIIDYPTQKVIKVSYFSPLSVGSEFDITLNFQWQASKAEPNNFDGMNLMYFRHSVGCLRYRINLPWQPVGQRVIAYGIDQSDPETNGPPTTDTLPDGTYSYSFEITNPKPLAYLIWLKDV